MREQLNMDLQTIPVLELLPQRPPFVLVDTLLACDGKRTTTAFTVKADHLLVDEGRLSVAGVMENMAQTCAAGMGYVFYRERQAVRMGYIGAVRDLRLHRCPRVGEHLVTTVEVLEEVFGMTLVRAEVYGGEELLAEAEMKIALAGDPSAEQTVL